MSIYINNQEVKRFKFPGGECHVQIDPEKIEQEVHLAAILKSSDDIISLLLTVDAIRRIKNDAKIFLTIPYFPYARQDRVCNSGEPLSVKVIANLINNLNCVSVSVIDPHSDVTPALLDHCKIKTMADIIKNSLLSEFITKNNITLVSPDAGAQKKVMHVSKSLTAENETVDLIFANKVRDVKTGKIIETEVPNNVSADSFIILDDICDGGSTFIALGKKLKQGGAKKLFLYVTHGIFSNGLDVFRESFDHVFCYHALCDEKYIDNSFVTMLSKKIFN